MSKQDRTASRTAEDVERKYNFGKTFAEMFGLVDEAKKAADKAQQSANNANAKLTPEAIFNLLTNNGEVQGIYRAEDGNVYINASYIVSGILTSKDRETFYLDLENGVLKGVFDELSISGKTVEEITQDKVDTFAEQVTKDIESLQDQIDGNVTTWFKDYVPTTSNEPASEWTTTELKNQHLGDLFYVVDNEEYSGYVYRWVLTDDTYKWVLVEDSEITKALELASKAQDTADGKRRVFVVQPIPPYDVGDLWTDGTDLKVCKTAKASGSYSAADWELATDYIDSDKAGEIAQDKVDAQTQADVFNRLTNNGEVEGIYLENGQLYINASYLATGILTSKDGKTFYLDLDNGVLKGQFAELSISGKTVDEIADTVVQAQTQTDIFNKLTNNGASEGLFMQDGQLYINASYLASGVIKSANGKLVIDLSGNSEPVFNTGISTNGLTIRGDAANAQELVVIQALLNSNGLWQAQSSFNSTNGTTLISATESFSGSTPVGVGMRFQSQDGKRAINLQAVNGLCGITLMSNGSSVGALQVLTDGTSNLTVNKINGNSVSALFSSVSALSNSVSGNSDNIIELYSNVNELAASINELAAACPKTDLLWENPNRTTGFAAQTVSVDLSGYDEVMVYFCLNSSTYNKHMVCGRCPVGEVLLGHFGWASTGITYHRTAETSETGIVFNAGYYNGGTYSTSCIPYRIYGIKH